MYTKFIDFKVYDTKKTKMGDNVVHLVVHEKATGKKVYDVYRVRYNTAYFHTDRVFDTYDKAYEYTRYCQIELNKQRFNNRTTEKYVPDVPEYPDNLLNKIGILPSDYANYYTEIVPNFNDNFNIILSKGLLSEREQLIIVNRYQHFETLESLGKSLKITRERVRQIEHKAIEKLQHQSFKNILIQGREKLELINAEERARLLEEIRTTMTKDIAIQVVLEQCTVKEVEQIISTLKKDKPEEAIWSQPVEELNLAVRSYNCLKRANINTIGELVCKTESEMMRVRNLGKKSLKEIKNQLKSIGLCFEEEDDYNYEKGEW